MKGPRDRIQTITLKRAHTERIPDVSFITRPRFYDAVRVVWTAGRRGWGCAARGRPETASGGAPKVNSGPHASPDVLHLQNNKILSNKTDRVTI